MRVFKIREAVYDVEPLFVLGCDADALVAYVKRHFKVDIERPEDGVIGTSITLRVAPWRIVWSKRNDLATVLHEVFHLTTRICHDRYIQIRAKNERGDVDDEAAACLFTFFARGVLKHMRKT